MSGYAQHGMVAFQQARRDELARWAAGDPYSSGPATGVVFRREVANMNRFSKREERITPKARAFLALLCEQGAVRPTGNVWQLYYSLERAGLAQKQMMNVLPTELGVIEYKKGQRNADKG